MRVSVIGTTSWGTTLAVILARRGIDVSLWARTDEEAEKLRRDGENTERLPGMPFPKTLTPVGDIAGALRDVSMVIFAVPSQDMRRNVALAKMHIDIGSLVLNAAKGFELETGKRMTQVVSDELGQDYIQNICTLSGPNLSREIATGLPAASVVAAYDIAVAEVARDILHSSTFHVYTSDDVVGVELGGALKNIVALGAGMVDGLGYGDNAKAAYMSHGLSEIAKLGVALGANPLTFLGLAGLGDLLATCDSVLSRNHTLGEGIARGYSLDEMMSTIGSAVEGVPTTVAALKIARGLGVDMPITERIYRVLYDGLDPAKAMAELIGDLNHM
ncbi:MAG: NAD(P)H-dependent glycerol-3-phosphate dehydrogenase [Chloroflexota bacterium]|nr:NAD(P)H-dependent glycerol-3-phosphate dehydrogenase [Chloroflexota bacterium]